MWKLISLGLFVCSIDFTCSTKPVRRIELQAEEKDSGGCEPNPQIFLVAEADRVMFVSTYAAGMKETVHLQNGRSGSTVFYSMGTRYVAVVNGKDKRFFLWSVQYGCHWAGSYG